MENNTVSSASTGKFAFGIFIEFIFLWTLLGNCIIIAVLKLYKPLTIPDILVFSLALSDLLNVLFPAQILNIIQSQLVNITWTKLTCVMFTWSVYCFRLASVLTVTVIALDRLIAIRKPFVYRVRVMPEIGRVKLLILMIWLFSCLTASLPYMTGSKSTFKSGECPYQFLDLGRYYGFFLEIIGLLQLALVLYCYIAIRISTWHFLKRQGKFRRVQLDRTTSNQAASAQDKGKMAAVRMNKQLSDVELTNSNSSDDRDSSPRAEKKTKRGSFIKHFGSKRRGSTTQMLTEGMKQVAKMEKMMAVLVFLFYLTWIPFLGSNLYSLVTRKSSQSIVKVIGVFSLINGFLNPIVYATIYPRYRKGYMFVFQTMLRLCGGKKPSITTADFNISKIGRSRRLQTLKELKSTESSMVTQRESFTLQVRQGWLKPASAQDMILEEHTIGKQTEFRDVAERLDEDSRAVTDNIDGGDSKVNGDIVTVENEDGVYNGQCVNVPLHTPDKPNLLESVDDRTEKSKNSVENCVSPTLIRIVDSESGLRHNRVCNSSVNVKSSNQISDGPVREDGQNDLLKGDVTIHTSARGLNCIPDCEISLNKNMKLGECTQESRKPNENVFGEQTLLVDATTKDIDTLGGKSETDSSNTCGSSYRGLANGSFINNGFTES